MRRIATQFLVFGILVITIVLFRSPDKSDQEKGSLLELKPNEWMLMQRMYPYSEINSEAYEQLREQSIQIHEEAARYKSGQEDWELVGPFNVGGRVTDVEMHSSDTETIYITAASGGIWKSTDKGKSWNQIFDNPYTQSIGDMAIAETDKNTLYVGTGEPNTGQGSLTYDGYGIFKSTNGGASWTPSGLENAGGIGRVEVDPSNSNRVFVAAMGNLFSRNPERGVYRTTDGGASWENVLFLNDSTGAIDLCIHPSNPNIIYAGMWERVRGPYHRTYGGPSSGLYRSTDGGDSWQQLSAGLPSGSQGRIGIDISRSNPNVLYVSYSNTDGTFNDVFKTINGGDSWTDLNSGIGGSTYSWWFSKVQIHPTNPDIVWVADFYLLRSTNGGQNWSNIGGLHVDQHAVYVHPADPSFVVTGNDGGVYLSENGGTTNNFVYSLPITQFYTCEVNYQQPEQRMGGTQDNGTQRTLTGESSDWSSIYGGDGFVVRVDPSNPNYMYASSQRGGFGRSTNGGQSFSGARPSGNNRYNWKTPYVLDPQNPSVVYIGAHMVYKSTNRAASWTRISDDLTNGDAGNWNYATLTSLAVSPKNSAILWAGSDDGNVWVTSNGGANKDWTKVSDALPVRWVSCVAADPFDERTGYVAFSGLRYHDYEPHLFRTTDLGASWEDISGNLPDFPVNNLIVDPDNQGTYYAATDNGVFVTYDAGQSWSVLGNGMPTVPVLDLNLHRPSRSLLAATFGRSMYRIKVKAASGTEGIEFPESALKVFPSPSKDEVHITFSLSESEKGSLLIYNMNGQIVARIHEGEFSQGLQEYVWNGKGRDQERTSGVYIARLLTKSQILSQRIVLQ